MTRITDTLSHCLISLLSCHTKWLKVGDIHKLPGIVVTLLVWMLALWASWCTAAIKNRLLWVTVLPAILYRLGYCWIDAALPVLRHWLCFLDLWSISFVFPGLFPVGWFWNIASKTGWQSSLGLASPGWRYYFTCPEGFSLVYTSSVLFAFFTMVLQCWMTFSVWLILPCRTCT